jgi:hypothetical protein
LLSPKEVDTIRDTFMGAAKDGPVEGLSDKHYSVISPDDPLARYPRMLHPHRHPDLECGRIAMRYMLDRRLYPILKELIGDEPVAVQSMFYFKPPGARGQELHQDNIYLRVKPGTCMAAWFAIDDADPDNGGMKVVPGSHNMDILCPEKADMTLSFTGDYVPVPEGMRAEHVNLKAGDVLFFNGSLIHGSTPNTSKERFRRSLICHYVPKESSELSVWYTNPLTFSGESVSIPEAVGGGPCGTAQPTGPH